MIMGESLEFDIGDVSVASSEEETNAVNASFVELSVIAATTDGNPDHTLRFLRRLYRRGFIDGLSAYSGLDEEVADEPSGPKKG